MAWPRHDPELHLLLGRARARLTALDLYPTPVRIRRVRVLVAPRLFRLPGLRRFDGYTAWNLILLRTRPDEEDLRLLVHELCHVWQMQHHPIRMPLSYLRSGYAANRFEAEARRAAGHAPARSVNGRFRRRRMRQHTR